MGITVTTAMADFGRQHASARSAPRLALSDIALDAEPAFTADDALFIESGLRAARASRSTRRAAILQDLARALGCAASDLDFLFTASTSTQVYGSRLSAQAAANDTDPLIMPEYSQVLRGDRFAAE